MTANQTAARSEWATVFRTGRTSAAYWAAAFGPAADPILDVGAGDSPWVPEMNAAHHFAVSVDPQYSVRPPRLRDATISALSPVDGQASDLSPNSSTAWPAVAGLAQALPFRDCSFGTVYLGYCLQHVGEPVSALRECLRVASPEGRVVIHPVWARGARRREAIQQPGASLIPGRRGHRPSLVLDPAFRFSEHSLKVIASALAPSKPIRRAGAIAMSMSIAICGTTGIGPGAVR